ncbi:hypothetical protein [Nocardioides sp.]|jgi:hypothetical protein|uniref:hypothetical protein n=1 Tax=Nocardioides sp. TaxID=35761 RepID=UPI0031FF270E|nr:hypothetical protein [Nocardioides sp.]
MTTVDTSELTRTTIEGLAAKLVRFLETNEAPPGLFSDDVFTDFTMPLWRLQAAGRADSVRLRQQGHPSEGRVPRTRLDATESGFLLEVEEEWEDRGQRWYCRELMRCDVADGTITQISVYCTGDWDEATVASHAEAVTLIRP